MHPFDKITSRDNDAFPFDDFLEYPHLLIVDWKEAENDMMERFFEAAELSNENTQLVWDEEAQLMKFTYHDKILPIPRGNEISAQHSMLMVFQQVYGNNYSIRYLNHVTAGDTGYFVVETPDFWQRLEIENPHVRWFFTPIECLPDTFETSFEELSEAGRRYIGEA